MILFLKILIAKPAIIHIIHLHLTFNQKKLVAFCLNTSIVYLIIKTIAFQYILMKKNKKLKGYKLVILKKKVDLRHLLTAYSTSHLPQIGLCDSCELQMNNNI